MNNEELDELMEYNLEYLEARNSEDIFGGDYTSAVDLKYINKEIEQLQQENKQYESDIAKLMYQNENLERENKQLKERIDKAIEYIEKLQDNWNNRAINDVNLYLFETLIKGVTKLLEVKEILKGEE